MRIQRRDAAAEATWCAGRGQGRERPRRRTCGHFERRWQMLAVPHPIAALCCALVLSTSPAQQAPAVVKLLPAHGSVELDTGDSTLSVTFDQDMDPKRHALCGGGASFPKVTKTSWTDARTFVLEVVLERDRVYALDLSCAGSGGFASAAGTRLPPTLWRFSTTGTPLRDDEAALAEQRLFAAVRSRYSYRDRLGIDWAQVQINHHEALAEAKSGASLALRLSEVLATAQDPHISVRWNECVLPTYQRTAESNFDGAALQRSLPKLSSIGRIGVSGRTDDGIGYLLVGTFAREQAAEFDLLLQAVRDLSDCKALVLDLRTNTGGDETIARRLAAFFADGEKVYAAHRLRDPDAPDGFDERQDRRVRGNGPPDTYTRPVAVLMGQQCMSSCEAFLLMMKQATNAILVGDRSYGSSGNPQPHALIQGVTVFLPSWQALLPDGAMFEGTGIEPHIHVPTAPPGVRKTDAALDEALLRLRGTR